MTPTEEKEPPTKGMNRPLPSSLTPSGKTWSLPPTTPKSLLKTPSKLSKTAKPPERITETDEDEGVSIGKARAEELGRTAEKMGVVTGQASSLHKQEHGPDGRRIRITDKMSLPGGYAASHDTDSDDDSTPEESPSERAARPKSVASNMKTYLGSRSIAPEEKKALTSYAEHEVPDIETPSKPPKSSTSNALSKKTTFRADAGNGEHREAKDQSNYHTQTPSKPPKTPRSAASSKKTPRGDAENLEDEEAGDQSKHETETPSKPPKRPRSVSSNKKKTPKGAAGDAENDTKVKEEEEESDFETDVPPSKRKKTGSRPKKQTPEGVTYNGRVKDRKLILWHRPRMSEKLLLHIQYEAQRAQITLPWDKIVRRLSPGSSGESAIQNLSRVRDTLISEGHIVPPLVGKKTAIVDESIRGYVRDENVDDPMAIRAVDWNEVTIDRKENLEHGINRGSGNYARTPRKADQGKTSTPKTRTPKAGGSAIMAKSKSATDTPANSRNEKVNAKLVTPVKVKIENGTAMTSTPAKSKNNKTKAKSTPKRGEVDPAKLKSDDEYDPSARRLTRSAGRNAKPISYREASLTSEEEKEAREEFGEAIRESIEVAGEEAGEELDEDVDMADPATEAGLSDTPENVEYGDARENRTEGTHYDSQVEDDEDEGQHADIDDDSTVEGYDIRDKDETTDDGKIEGDDNKIQLPDTPEAIQVESNSNEHAGTHSTSQTGYQDDHMEPFMNDPGFMAYKANIVAGMGGRQQLTNSQLYQLYSIDQPDDSMYLRGGRNESSSTSQSVSSSSFRMSNYYTPSSNGSFGGPGEMLNEFSVPSDVSSSVNNNYRYSNSIANSQSSSQYTNNQLSQGMSLLSNSSPTNSFSSFDSLHRYRSSTDMYGLTRTGSPQMHSNGHIANMTSPQMPSNAFTFNPANPTAARNPFQTFQAAGSFIGTDGHRVERITLNSGSRIAQTQAPRQQLQNPSALSQPAGYRHPGHVDADGSDNE